MTIAAVLAIWRIYLDPDASVPTTAIDWRFHLVWLAPLFVVAFSPWIFHPYLVTGRDLPQRRSRVATPTGETPDSFLNPRVGGHAPPRSRMMSDMDYRPDPDELDDAEFERALRALRRRRVIGATLVLGALVAFFIIPWSQSVGVSGRVAPAHWARVRSEVPGIVREVKHNGGDAVEEGDVIAVLDSNEQRDALEAARLALTRERQKLADLELRLRQNSILREGADAAVREAERRAVAAERRGRPHRGSAARGCRRARGRPRLHDQSAGQLVVDGRTRRRRSTVSRCSTRSTRRWQATSSAPRWSPTT